MADFIGENGCWDPKALFIHLMEEDVVCVLDIPLCERKPKDVLYWWPTFDGIYSTKFGYWFGRLGHLCGWAERFDGDNSEVWQAVWNVGGPPKLSHFIWRACLATRGRLHDHHILDDGLCNHCSVVEVIMGRVEPGRSQKKFPIGRARLGRA